MAPISKKRKQALAVLVALQLRAKRHHREANMCRKRLVWTKPWLLLRESQGAYHNLIQELRLQDQDSYRCFLRMDVAAFEELLEKVTPHIQRSNTTFRQCIPPGERLAITLRFLATGESYRSLSFQYRVGRSTISNIVPETCRAIYSVLKEEHFQTPTTEDQWRHIAQGFTEKWHFPNCLGALDGKHVTIRPPPNTGSVYFNYKHSFSLVLMALVDADYKFIYVDVGANGRVADAGVFRQSSLDHALQKNMLSVPQPDCLPGTDIRCPYAIVADEAFPLRNDLMKPYPHRSANETYRIFNYRLSRARRVVENAFGILANRFRVFMTPISLPPSRVEDVIMASCALHNFLRSHQSASDKYVPYNFADTEDENTHVVAGGEWRTNGALPKSVVCTRQRYSIPAKEQREVLRRYFTSPQGEVSWQYTMV